MYTNEEIVQYRLNEIYNELMDLESEGEALKARLEKIEYLKKVRAAEYRMLQNVKDKGAIVAEDGRVSRIFLEDALKKIFDKAGRPMKIADVIEEVEKFGVEWSRYQTAYYRLTELLKPTGARGYYQYR